jgi:hypothetical protein
MTDPEPQPDRDLLTRIAIGELPADAPEVLARRSRDPAFGVALDELLRTVAELERAGSEERASIADAALLPGDAGMRPDLVAETIGRLAGSTGAEAPAVRAQPRWTWALLAAAAAVAMVWFFWRDPAVARPDDRPLGSQHLEILPPRLDGDALLLQWTTDLTGAGFAVSIWLAEDPTRRALLDHDTKETLWRIEAADWRPLQTRQQALRWGVVASRGSLTVEQDGELVLPR